VTPDVVLNCPRAAVRQPPEPAMVGHYDRVIRPHLPGLHSVIAPVRSSTGQLLYVATYLVPLPSNCYKTASSL